ncbi:hypothetical protein EDC04DRAFT_2588942, partial [Pisolithus marmoratus]
AQVHVIFKLPDHFGIYPHPLTYIKWFTSLHRHDTLTGLYLVNHSTQNCHPNVSVVSVNFFVHACHLQGSCGRHISTDWMSDNVLQITSTFHVNSYIDLDTFFVLS